LIYIDANAFIFFLHDVKPRSDIVEEVLSREYEVYTSLRTIEEVSYVLIRVKAAKLFDVKVSLALIFLPGDTYKVSNA